VEATRKQLASRQFSFAPTINLFGSYEWNDDVLLGTGSSNYLVGATLKWNLFSGYKNISAMEQSRAQLSRARLQYQDRILQNRVEIQSSARTLESAREQVEVARSTVEQAAESYRIRRNRYEQGMERVSDLLMSEATLAESKLQLASAIFKFNLQAARLEFLLEKDLTP
ncbi:MAG: TolC family protein, partial [Balneolaceae bacterium]|nr:TolC family protein [Balneolaceae bacterium]